MQFLSTEQVADYRVTRLTDPRIAPRSRLNDDWSRLSESDHMPKEKNFARGPRIRSGGQTGVDRAALDAAWRRDDPMKDRAQKAVGQKISYVRQVC